MMSHDPALPRDDDGLIRAMRSYYDGRASEYDEWYLRAGQFDTPEFNDQWTTELDQIRRRITAIPGRRVLEVACGTGYWTQHLGPSRRVVAVDASPAMLKRARSRLVSSRAKAIFCQADAYQLPFEPECFDAAIHAFWISHVPAARLNSFLGMLHRQVRPGGTVFCVDGMQPSSTKPHHMVDEKRSVQMRTLRDGSRFPVVKIHYSPDTLREHLAPWAEELAVEATGCFFVTATYKPKLSRSSA